MTANKKLSRN